MKKFKSILTVVMIFALAIAFSACGESGKVKNAQSVVDEFYKAIKEADFDTAVSLTANGTNINSTMNELKDFFASESFISVSQEIPEGCEDTVKKYSDDIEKLALAPYSTLEYTVNSTNPSEEIVVIKVNTNFLLSELQFSNIQKLFVDAYTDKVTNFSEEELAEIQTMNEKDSFLYQNKIAYEIYEKMFKAIAEKVNTTKTDLSIYVQKIDKDWKIIEIK